MTRSLLPLVLLSGCWPLIPGPYTAGDADGGPEDTDDPLDTDVADTDDGGGDTEDTDGGGGDTDTPPTGERHGACLAPPAFDYGPQLTGIGLRAKNYDHDANLDDVIAATEYAVVPTAVNIPVTGAIVTMLGYTADGGIPEEVWLADQNGAVRTYGVPMPDVKVGDALTFRVKEVLNYFGEYEVTAVGVVTIDSTGNDVFVRDSPASLDYAKDGREVVHLWGELVSDDGGCGGSASCYTFEYGGATPTVLRIGTAVGLQQGDCVEVTWPTGYFETEVQLDVADYEQLRVY